MRTDLALAVASAVLLSACIAGRRAPVVAPVPETPKHFAATRIVAYGDSLTEGFLQACPGDPAPVPKEPGVSPAKTGLRGSVASPFSYPAHLQALLGARYPNQPFEIINEGVGGEEIEAGAAALGRVLVGDGPDALLLLEGVNSVNARHGEAIPGVVALLRGMVQEAKKRGVAVFVGTLLPEREGGCRAYDYLDKVDDIVQANIQIRTMVGNEGAELVDLYQAFNGRTATLLGPDGLHPSAAGYRVIAATFFAALRRQLEEE